MEIFFIKAFQLILCLSLLIVLHEGGHFLFAKLFKIRVEKFCLFFDPWKSWKLFSFRGTDYHIGWLPLGGYVKISGMIDESMDTEAMKQPVQSWEFRAKPAWQRLFVMIGGVLVNFLFAMFIYAMILFTWGEQFIPIEKMNQGFEYNKSALALGFQDGDIPIRTNQGDLERFNGNAIRMISEASSVTVLRNGTEVEITTPGNLNLLEMLQSQPPFIAPRCPALIDSVLPKSPAQTAGLKKGDRILAFNQENIDSWNDFDSCASPAGTTGNIVQVVQGQFCFLLFCHSMDIRIRQFNAIAAGGVLQFLNGGHFFHILNKCFVVFIGFQLLNVHNIPPVRLFLAALSYMYTRKIGMCNMFFGNCSKYANSGANR